MQYSEGSRLKILVYFALGQWQSDSHHAEVTHVCNTVKSHKDVTQTLACSWCLLTMTVPPV